MPFKKKCQQCGKSFTSEIQSTRKKYCSKPCLHKSMSKTFDWEEFWGCVDKKGPNGCWVWTWLVTGRYGRYRRDGVPYQSHRLSWEYHNRRSVPDGLWVLHHCDNPICVNPAHLFLGTHDDNVQDKVNKGRQVRGSRQVMAKFTEEQVLDVRRKLDQGVFLRVLAKEYGVGVDTIWNIKKRRTWKHI